MKKLLILQAERVLMYGSIETIKSFVVSEENKDNFAICMGLPFDYDYHLCIHSSFEFLAIFILDEAGFIIKRIFVFDESMVCRIYKMFKEKIRPGEGILVRSKPSKGGNSYEV